MQLRISGQHVGGGRGMAFWYAAEPNQDGPIFGSKDNWKGLGIWFDSYNPKVRLFFCFDLR
jgi:Legume-like lectin family